MNRVPWPSLLRSHVSALRLHWTRKPRRFMCRSSARVSPAAQPLVLRDYQTECILRSLEAMERGVKSQAVSLPVGSGKTVIFAHLIPRVLPPKPGADKVLVLAHREELINQAWLQIRRANKDMCVIVDKPKWHHSEPPLADADVIVASVAGLGWRGSKRLARFHLDDFKLIIIDEAHHAVGSTYLRVLSHFRALRHEVAAFVDKKQTALQPIKKADEDSMERTADCRSHVYVWGCSATLMREDNIALGSVFDAVTFQMSLEDMWRRKHLVPLRSVLLHTTANLDGVKKCKGDFDTNSLSLAVNTPERNTAVVQAWKKIADENKRCSTLAFATNVAHARGLCQAFNAHGIAASVVVGTTSENDRLSSWKNFSEGRLPVLVNASVYTEGADVPIVDCILLARPTRSRVLFMQVIGRGLRLDPGKKDCLLIECVDNYSGRDLKMAPCLVGLPMAFKSGNLDMVAVKDMMVRLSRLSERCLRAKSVESAMRMCGIPGKAANLEELEKLISEHAAGVKEGIMVKTTERNVNELIRGSVGTQDTMPVELQQHLLSYWIRLNKQCYGLSLPGGAVLIIKSMEKWEAYLMGLFLPTLSVEQSVLFDPDLTGRDLTLEKSKRRFDGQPGNIRCIASGCNLQTTMRESEQYVWEHCQQTMLQVQAFSFLCKSSAPATNGQLLLLKRLLVRTPFERWKKKCVTRASAKRLIDTLLLRMRLKQLRSFLQRAEEANKDIKKDCVHVVYTCH